MIGNYNILDILKPQVLSLGGEMGDLGIGTAAPVIAPPAAVSGITDKILGASGKAIGGAFQAIGSLFGGRKRRRRERAARKDFKRRAGDYEAFDITNPFTGMENTYDSVSNPYEGLTNELNDLRVSTEAADFEAQQTQQGLAQSLDAFRGAGGGSGAASLATALAQEQRRSMQGIAANIAQQEVDNTRMARQADMNIQSQTAEADLGIQTRQAAAGMNIQQLEATGESARQEKELDRKGDLYGIAASELSAAREARQQATSDLFGGIGKMFGGD
jgi:hypothetical protein